VLTALAERGEFPHVVGRADVIGEMPDRVLRVGRLYLWLFEQVTLRRTACTVWSHWSDKIVAWLDFLFQSHPLALVTRMDILMSELSGQWMTSVNED
jgi:hypothetical protein